MRIYTFYKIITVFNLTGLKTVQIMSGAVTIMQYLGLIMEESKANITVSTVLLIFGIKRFILGKNII